jgi:ubiquitin
MLLISLALLFTTVLFTGLFAAMDTVIPGMDQASAAQKKAIQDQRARDSVRQQEEMGRQRFQMRMQYKSRLVEGMRIEAVARKNAIEREGELEELAIQESHKHAGRALRFIFCMGMLSTGAFLFRHQISSLDWLVALQDWFSSVGPQPESPARRAARLERKPPIQVPASTALPGADCASQASDSNTPGSPTQTDHPVSEVSPDPLSRFTPPIPDELRALFLDKTGPVDMEALLTCANGDVHHMHGMALLYLEQTRMRIDMIKAALTEDSRSKAVGWVKMGVSVSEFCGMKSIKMAFENLQISIQTDAIANALPKADSVVAECEQVRAYLQTHLSSMEKSDPPTDSQPCSPQ